ncbi:MAG: hypothetical protein ACTSPB_25540 [Candidatus Thorarchaeota archaeon]
MGDKKGYKYTKTDACAVIGAIMLSGVGFVISSIIAGIMQDVPSGFGSPPIFILFMTLSPIIMFTIPLIFCISMMQRARKKSEGPEIHRYRDETIVYSGDYDLHSEPKSDQDKKVYLIPTNYPACNRPLSTSEVEWIGPLQAKCPHCGATVEAEVRE